MFTCQLCPHACRLSEGKIGRCRQRTVRQGQVVPLSFGQVTAIAVDPIEKKPLYHFYPGSNILSVGGLGCNLHCKYCQNHHIAQAQSEVQTEMVQPADLVELALAAQRRAGNIGIAFTYNEPTMAYEFVQETATLAQAEKLKTVLVTNGYLQPGPWRDLLTHIDALNIDVKAFTEKAYQELCGASLGPVKRNVELAYEQSHVELTYLVVPGINDDPEEMKNFASWVAGLSPDIPVHLARYYPSYKLTIGPTPLTTLENLATVASEYLNFVYLGNVGLPAATFCPDCGQLLIARGERAASKANLLLGKCSKCGRNFPTIQLAEA